MAKIYQFPTPLIGSEGVFPTPKYAVFGDDLAVVTQPGYLASISSAYPIQSTDLIQAFYNFDLQSKSGDFGIFTVSIGENGVVTLSLYN